MSIKEPLNYQPPHSYSMFCNNELNTSCWSAYYPYLKCSTYSKLNHFALRNSRKKHFCLVPTFSPIAILVKLTWRVEERQRKHRAIFFLIICLPAVFYLESTQFIQKLIPFTLGCPVEKHACFCEICHLQSAVFAKMNNGHFTTWV